MFMILKTAYEIKNRLNGLNDIVYDLMWDHHFEPIVSVNLSNGR